MNETQAGKPVRFKRKRYVVDRELQATLTIKVLATMAGVGLLYVAGLFVIPGQPALESLSAAETRRLLLSSAAIYFALMTAIVGVVCLLLTHRVAGPAFVVQRALDAMRAGDYAQRVTLRRNDYLKGLAASVLHLAGHLHQKEAERAVIVKDLERCLQEGDLSAARELLTRLRPEPSERVHLPAAAPVSAAAPASKPGGC